MAGRLGMFNGKFLSAVQHFGQGNEIISSLKSTLVNSVIFNYTYILRSVSSISSHQTGFHDADRNPTDKPVNIVFLGI
jgi:hypothetical protein